MAANLAPDASGDADSDPAFDDILDLLLDAEPEEEQSSGDMPAVGKESTTSAQEDSGSFLDNITLVQSPVSALPDKHRQDREAKRSRNSGDLLPQNSNSLGPDAPYDVLHVNKKNIAEGVWDRDTGVVELMTLRGNFWKVMGYTDHSTQLLNPEEALLLVERSQLVVRSVAQAHVETKHIASQYFYQEVLHFVPQAVILTYVKLKYLDYITLRHAGHYGNDEHSLREKVFACDADVYASMRRYPERTILDTLVAFDVYPQSSSWTKRGYLDSQTSDPSKKPRGYVIVQTGDWTMNSRLMVHLLKAAKGVPIIFAAVLPSGNLILEEFTDATTSLKWDNEHAIDITYFSKVSFDTLVKRGNDNEKNEKDTEPEQGSDDDEEEMEIENSDDDDGMEEEAGSEEAEEGEDEF
jgi:hypothetical protein